MSWWPDRPAGLNEPGELMTTHTPRWWRIPRVAQTFMPFETMRRGPVKALTDEVDGAVALRIRAARAFRGMRQCDLAAAVAITQSSLSRIERGQRSVTIAELVRIAVQLRRPLAEFLDPPERGVRVGWERTSMEPLYPYWLGLAARAGELHEDDPFFD